MQIYIGVKDKVAQLVDLKQYIVCGNSDYIINFLFDDEWNDHPAKTARFEWGNKSVEIPFTGSQCPCPVITDTIVVRIGVFAGDLDATTPAFVMCRKSILCGSGGHDDPSLDVYNQLMGLLDEMQTGGASPEDIENAVAAYFEKNPVETPAESAVFIVDREKTTHKEVENAVIAGKFCVMFSSGYTYVLADSGNTGVAYDFYAIDRTRYLRWLRLETDNTWTPQQVTLVSEQMMTKFLTQYSDDNQIPTAKAVYTAIADKVSLPTNEDGTPNHGTVGYYAVSDGAGGIKWVASGNTGGGTDEPVTPNTHGIVWDLVNVTSSNPITSVSHGASLIAVLTAATGYTLGDVTVTMGGEVLTGVWNADTATVTIASVTGDVVVSCAGVEQGEIDTTAVIEYENYGISGSTGNKIAKEGWGITKFYPTTATNFTYYYTNNAGIETPASASNKTMGFTQETTVDGTSKAGYFSPSFGVQKTGSFSSTPVGVRATVVIAEVDNYYLYETATGNIIFAGKNTPYYGMLNINGNTGGGTTTASELSFDDDVAQNYSIATTSILGDEPVTDTSTAYGISAEFAEVITNAKKEWMIEYGGDYRKIPLIISTDQHGRRNSGIFNLIADTVNMYDVSKICNLGDTVSSWVDADAEHPLLIDAGLEAWMESVKKIPFSKRLDVYGNHDTWYSNYEDEGNPIGTRYPSTQEHLYQYFRNIYARRTNSNGWFVVHDDMFDVKYVVVSGFEYQGAVTFRIGTAQMAWLIDELEKNDGYDVVIVSHVPLYENPELNIYPTGQTSTTVGRVSNLDTDAFFAARKTKGSGTITDSDGVEHSYDFSGCDSDVLCSLHGHTHYDAYLYLEDSLLVNAFDWFADNTFFMVLVDRVNRCLNVWKIEAPDGVPTYQNYHIPFDKPTV